MRQNLRIKPSKQVSVGGLIVAIGMLIFAVVFFGAVSSDMDSDAALPVSVFFIIFILVILTLIVYYAYNIFSNKGIATLNIETDVENTNSTTSTEDTETRLNKLESLKEKGLISEDEYKKQREEIIKSI